MTIKNTKEVFETVKGFRDFTGEEAIKREIIKDILVRNFKLYGFEPAETPIIEFEDFVKGTNQSDEAVSDIFKLQDKGKRKLALRYEFTFQLKRISQNKKLPYRRYQIGEVFRDEPVSSNRFRQFTQCDVDVIGSTIRDEAEILSMTKKIFKELGIKVSINFNNRKLLNEILGKEGIKNKLEVIKEIDKLNKLSEKEVRNNLKKYKAEKILDIFKNKKNYFQKYDAYKEIEEFENVCKDYAVEINFQPFLARGLSYYNGTVIEVNAEGMKESIASGGSYMINNVQSTGISFGMNRISSLANIPSAEKRIVIISIGQDNKAIDLAENLRSERIPCLLFFNKVSKALEYANSYSLPYVIFFGEEEAKRKKLKLRDMKTGAEEFLTENQVIEKFKR